MYSFKLIYFIIFLLNLGTSRCEISPKKLCMDKECKEPISLAKTLLTYSSPESRRLSFRPNVDIKIFSKLTGSSSLWEAEIDGKRGYVPSKYVREVRMFGKPTILVNTELDQPVNSVKNIFPDKVDDSFEIVDGTTIFNDSPNSISPSSTQSPALATSIPNENKDHSSAVPDVSKDSNNDILSSFSKWMSDGYDDEPDDAEDDEEGSDEEDDEEDNDPEEDDIDNDKLKEQREFISLKQSSPLTSDKVQSVIEKSVEEESPKISLNEASKKEETIEVTATTNDIPVEEKISIESQKDTEPEVLKEQKESFETTTEVYSDFELPKPPQAAEVTQNPVETVTENLVETVTDKPVEAVTDKSFETATENPVETVSGNTVGTVTENTFGAVTEDVKSPDITSSIHKIDTLPTNSPAIDDNENTNTPKEKLQQNIDNEQNLENNTSAPVEKSEDTNVYNDSANNITTSGKETNDNVKDLTKENSNFESEIKEAHITSSTEAIPELNSNNVVNIETGDISPALQYGQGNPETSDASFTNSVEKNENNDSEYNKLVQSDPDIPPEKTYSEKETLPDTIVDSSPKETSVNNVNLEYYQEIGKQDEEKYSHAEVVNKSVSFSEDILSSKESGVLKNAQDVALGESVQNEFNANVPKPYVLNENYKSYIDNGSFESGIGIDSNSSADYLSQNDRAEKIEGAVGESSSQLLSSNIESEYSDKSPVSDEIPTDNMGKEQFSVDDGNNDEFAEKQFVFEEKILEESKDTFSETFLTEENNGDQIHGDSVFEESGGLFSSVLSWFKNTDDVEMKSERASSPATFGEQLLSDAFPSKDSNHVGTGYCDAEVENCRVNEDSLLENMKLSFNYDIFLYLATTAVSCIIFLFMYMAMDNSKRMTPLISKINKLEKELLVLIKENELLKEKESLDTFNNMNSVPTDEYNLLTERLAELESTKQALELHLIDLQKELEGKEALEDQIDSLEKELETSTEVGMELNRIIAEMLETTNGSEKWQENVEQFQRQLMEQKSVIASVNKALSIKESENIELLAELEIRKRKVNNLQEELDGRIKQILEIEKAKDQQQKLLQDELLAYQQKYNESVVKSEISNNEVQVLKSQLSDAQRQAELRVKEYHLLKESLNNLKSMKNDKGALELLLESTSKKAEYEQLKLENERYAAQLKQEQTAKSTFENKCQAFMEENKSLLRKYQEADKEKVEINMKLEVLTNYFKKKEEELQGEILKYKSIWDAREGEATSTSERIRLVQEEIENYKSQNETLKQEILSQEIDLKSQISILEKKVHENWVTARQTERKLEDARQEAAQLRNRLTLRERAIAEDRSQNRIQSPLDQNGDLALSPHPIESAASPPLLYGGRDHITKSPPLPALPPHFLPPPPGAPFMPPPLPGMPFMPPPPTMFPVDHRPPPLGRLSSPPPLNSRYSPDTSAFSPYSRNSPSPPYDSEYGASPPPMRRYSPYDRDDRRDYKRQPHVTSNGRNLRGSMMSSGSEHSNDSLDKVNQKQSKMV